MVLVFLENFDKHMALVGYENLEIHGNLEGRITLEKMDPEFET
jgi:hypothetical protein